jgi:predicted solute-binding protein
MQRIREIAEAASVKLDLPISALERYLTDHVDFSLDQENLAGLELYFAKAAQLGLIPRNKPLEFASASAESTTHRIA